MSVEICLVIFTYFFADRMIFLHNITTVLCKDRFCRSKKPKWAHPV
jgi:hypothetical protein